MVQELTLNSLKITILGFVWGLAETYTTAFTIALGATLCKLAYSPEKISFSAFHKLFAMSSFVALMLVSVSAYYQWNADGARVILGVCVLLAPQIIGLIVTTGTELMNAGVSTVLKIIKLLQETKG